MRVLHVIDSQGVYGAEVMLLGLMEEQRKLGIQPVLASIGQIGIREKQIEYGARKRGLTAMPFRMHNGPNPFGVYQLLRFARNGNFDLIHSHGYKPNILLGLIPQRIRKIPMIATLHGWTSMRRFSKMGLYEWLDRKSLRFFDQVIVVSEAMLQREKIGQDKRIGAEVVHNGVAGLNGTEKRVQENDEIVQFCTSGFTVGSVGRLSEEKGYRYLLEAVAGIRKAGVDARLVIIGEGPQRKALIGMIGDLGLGPWVLLPGYREHASAYMAYLDVFVLSSLTEGLPITLLEAMQTGIPVVATTVGGIPEVLKQGRAGVLVSPADSDSLAAALSRLHGSPALRTELGREGKELVRAHFSGEIMAQRYRRVYEAVLEKTRIADRVTRNV